MQGPWQCGLVIVCLVVLLSGTGYGADLAHFHAAKLERFSKPIALPEFSLPDVQGQPVSFHSFKGSIVLLNFWTTWWPHCLRERAALEALHQRYKARGLAVVAVNMSETAAQVKAYVARHRLSFAHLLDPDQQAVSLLGVPAAPTTILIDHKGRVLGGGLGYRDWASLETQQLIESLLKELPGK